MVIQTFCEMKRKWKLWKFAPPLVFYCQLQKVLRKGLACNPLKIQPESVGLLNLTNSKWFNLWVVSRRTQKAIPLFSPGIHLNQLWCSCDVFWNKANLNISDGHKMKIPKPKRYYFHPAHMQWHACAIGKWRRAPGHKIPLWISPNFLRPCQIYFLLQ